MMPYKKINLTLTASGGPEMKFDIPHMRASIHIILLTISGFIA